MRQHAAATALPHRVSSAISALVAWHDSRPRASFADARGWMWVALIAASVFWLSNPLVFIPSFYLALGQALIWTKVAVALNLPWLRLPRVPWPWVAFLVLAYLSQTWTVDDFHTDVSNIVYLELTVLAVVTAVNCTPEVVAWGVASGGAVVVAMSQYAFALELPGSSNAAIGGAVFTGVGTNENILAYTLCVSLASTLALGCPRSTGARCTWVMILALHAYGVVRAGSGSGFLTTLALAITLVAVHPRSPLRSARRRRVVGGVAALAGAALLAVVWLVLVQHKDLASFSGRVPFWAAIVESTMAREPLIGSGWGSVWQHPWNPAAPNDVAADIYARAGYPLTHGHNFFLDVLPELGLAGLALVVAMVLYAVNRVRVVGVRSTDSGLSGRLVLFVLVALIVFGITEPMATVPIGWWSLALVVTLSRRPAGSRNDRPGGAPTTSRAGARRAGRSPVGRTGGRKRS